MASLINDNNKKNSNGMATELSNKVQESKNQVSNLVYDSGEKIGNVASDLANSAMESFKTSREYVKENPYKGVVMAAVIGLLSGTLLSALMRRK